MTESSDQRLPIATEEKTTVGNYFVANYPPFSFWTPDLRPEAMAAIEREPATNTPLGLYIHIPFCRKRCHFCYFRVYTDKNSTQIKDYMNAVIGEMAMYADKPFIGGRKPRFIYFGGGTPSYLSAQQLTYLTDELKAHLPWDEAEEIAFECEPGTLNQKKLQAIRDFGVTRLSLGVENFDDHVLELNNRAHLSKQVLQAYQEAREVGFPQINIDLIAGMLGETEDNWKQCVEKAIELAPDAVTIYQMEIPYNTTIYQQMKAEGKSIAPVASWTTKRRWVLEAFTRLEAEGYTITSAYTAVRDAGKAKFLYRDDLWRGADMLGIGVASFSHVNGVHFQNQHNIEPYIQSVRDGNLPVYRALPVTEDEKLIREFVLQLKLGRVSRSYFRDKFGVDVAERFAEPLKQHRDDGYMSIDGDSIRVSREGLLEVDRLLHEFFLPKHRDVRYA